MYRPFAFRRFLLRGLLLFFLLLLPFVSLVRTGVFLHRAYGLSPWVSLAGGFFLSGGVLFLYLLYVQRRWLGRLPTWRGWRWQYLAVAGALAAYCVPALLTLSMSNAKSDAVREEFRSLHPLLRLGVSTLIWMDPGLVLTDADRGPEDYDRMGLPRQKDSKHFRQADGYAHALDIRTRGRPEGRNTFVVLYFRGMGFDCYRHVGTADHLHVSLPGPGH